MKGMNSGDLRLDQLEAMRDALRPKLKYLTAIRNRMTQRGFPEDDHLYRCLRLAQETMSATVQEVEKLMRDASPFR